LESYKENHPDIILMDLIMPKMGGIEAAQKIRGMAGSKRVDIIAITASYFESPEKQFGAMTDFLAVLTKPFKVEDLLDIFSDKVGLEFENIQSLPLKKEERGRGNLVEWISSRAEPETKSWCEAIDFQDMERLKEMVEESQLPNSLREQFEGAIKRHDLIFLIELGGDLKLALG